MHPRVVLPPSFPLEWNCLMDTDLAVPMPKRELYFVFGALMLGMLVGRTRQHDRGDRAADDCR